jgi:hypothetical protein
MIVIPDLDDAYLVRGMFIDNGTDTMGVSIIDLDLRRKRLIVKFSETCTASKSIGRYEGAADIHGARFARFQVLRGFLLQVVDIWQPCLVGIESPFSHLHAESFATLRESLHVVRDTCWEVGVHLEIDLVAPMSAKKAVNAKSYVGKNPMRDAVLALKDVDYDEGIDPEQLDEHCIDSIGVAKFIANRLFEQFSPL